MTQHYQNYIGGTWVRAASTRTFDDINPADRDEVLGTFPRADGCDVDLDEAVEIANATAYGLSSAIYTQDIGRAFRAIEALATGVTCVNASAALARPATAIARAAGRSSMS